MGVSDAAGWTGDGIAVASIGIAARSLRQSKVARELAAHSESRADSIATSMTMMAKSLEQIAEHQNASARDDASEPEVADLPRFAVELGHGSEYVLRNVGARKASGLTVSAPDEHRGLTRYLPENVTIEPFQSVTFTIFRVAEVRDLREVEVRCDQIPGPIYVPLPPG